MWICFISQLSQILKFFVALRALICSGVYNFFQQQIRAATTPPYATPPVWNGYSIWTRTLHKNPTAEDTPWRRRSLLNRGTAGRTGESLLLSQHRPRFDLRFYVVGHFCPQVLYTLKEHTHMDRTARYRGSLCCVRWESSSRLLYVHVIFVSTCSWTCKLNLAFRWFELLLTNIEESTDKEATVVWVFTITKQGLKRTVIEDELLNTSRISLAPS